MNGMGSPKSLLVANFFLYPVESKALVTFNRTIPPRLYVRYVNDTFAIFKSAQKDSFLQALNQCKSIKFTMESEDTNKVTSFLDCQLKIQYQHSQITGTLWQIFGFQFSPSTMRETGTYFLAS